MNEFMVTDSMGDIPISGTVIINGQSNSVNEFVEGLDIPGKWQPFGYDLIAVFAPKDTCNMTAYLTRNNLI